MFFYHDDSTKILDSFKGRTRLLGKLGQNNCTLEIVEVKDHDNGPFCFRIELVRQDTNQPTKEKFSFVEKCADVIMKRMYILHMLDFKASCMFNPFLHELLPEFVVHR